jgi:phospholipid N-methyltransferase
MQYLTQCREFYHEFRHAYKTTGSILPSSRNLGRALASPFRRRPGPARVLEIGPGSGAVTEVILRLMRPDDRLDIVEINANFVEVLRRRFDEEPVWQAHKHQMRLFHSPLRNMHGMASYDYVISGLPLNNFPISLVREIFQDYQRLLKPHGILSYFEYLAIREVKKTLVTEKERRRLRVLDKFLQRRIRAFQVREQWIFLNFPPAVARHFCFSN